MTPLEKLAFALSLVGVACSLACCVHNATRESAGDSEAFVDWVFFGLFALCFALCCVVTCVVTPVGSILK